MLKKTVTYTDYNGVERTEDFYFHLSEAEILEMEFMTEGGLGEKIQRVVAAQDIPTIVSLFKDLVFRAYGEKSADGKRFVKSPEISLAFSQSPAYSAIFMELATNADLAAAFVNGIVPDKLRGNLDSDAALLKFKAAQAAKASSENETPAN